MNQDKIWDLHHEAVMCFLRTNQRQPSKHRAEDHFLLNWLKYNRRLLAKGLLPAHRVQRFRELLAFAKKFRRVNQYG